MSKKGALLKHSKGDCELAALHTTNFLYPVVFVKRIVEDRESEI